MKKNLGSNIISDNKANILVDFKEYNLNDYYIKIGYNSINELIIIIYNTELLDNHRYEIKKGLESVLNFHKFFKTNNHISDIYKQINSFINEGKYKIKLNGNDSMTLTLNKLIDFNLICHKDNNEYFQILSNQIKNLRNKNNTYNKTINKLQEENSSIKKEIKELKNMISNIQNNNNKFNKKKNSIDIYLSSHKKTFSNKKLFSDIGKNSSFTNLQVVKKEEVIKQEEETMSISEFNQKCGTSLKDENITELNLINYKLGDDIIDDLGKIKLNQLQLLYLSYNNILDINNLKDVQLDQLTLLILSYNKITDINVLEKVKFEKLQILGLSSNKITDISILEKAKFGQLQNLYLDGNQITNIEVFERVKFPSLQELNLSSNKINNINVFSKVKFNQLQELYLTNNNIIDINVLEKVKFDQLQKLELGGNKIKDIKVLEKVKFLKLKKLFLYMNNINDIEVLGKINFKEMNELNLNDNSFDKKKNEHIIIELKKKIKNFFI